MKRPFEGLAQRWCARRARKAGREVAASWHSGIRSVTEAPIPRASLWLLSALVGFVFVALVWATVGRLDVTAVAQGATIVSSRVKDIQSPQRAVVDRVPVSDGDRVAAGEVVVGMRARGVVADVRNLEAELRRSRLAIARLEALIRAQEAGGDRRPELDAPAAFPAHLVERERQLMMSEWAAYRDRVRELERERANRKARLATIRASIDSISAVLPYLRDRVGRLERLVERDVASRQELDDARRELVAREKEQQVEQHRLQEARAQLDLIDQRMQGLASEFRTEKTSALAEFEARVDSSRQELVKARARLDRMTLRAPINGVVQDVSVHAAGAVVEPKDVLMRIVPEDQPLEVEAKILNRDIGFAHEGQEVDVKLQAFDFTRYGAIPGVIRKISSTSVRDEKLGQVYTALVELKRHHIIVEGEPRPLRPGLTATIDIDMGSRRIIEYFLAPILRYRDEALSER